MNRNLLLLVCLFSVTVCAAQRSRRYARPVVKDYTETIVQRYTDSLSALQTYYDSTWTYKGKDLLLDPYYYRLFSSPTFYYSPVAQQMENLWTPRSQTSRKFFGLDEDLNDTELERNKAINKLLADFYISYPQFIHENEQQVDNAGGLREGLDTKIKHDVVLAEKIKPKEPEEVVEPVRVVSHRPNFWTFRQAYSLQMQQNYISDNWYQGGDNFSNFLATINWKLNYDNKQKVLFENTLDIKLGMQSVKADSIHKWHTNTDQIRLTNKLDLRAIGKWYYSILLQSWTQMFPKYSNNSHTAYSDIFSPFETTLSVGMDYKHNKKNWNVSVHLAPFAFDYKYVARSNLETRYLGKRKHFLESYGSNITISSTLKIMKELTWSSRLYYYTNYNKVQTEWENTFNFTINKYLSSKLYLYPRFDDTQKDSEGRRRIQFKQFLSLGFNMSL